MAKEGIPTEADILAAIDLGARAAGEEARKGFGLKPNVPVVTDPVVQAADVAVSEKPAIAPVSGDGHPADVERAKKGGVGRKRVIKKKKGAPARGGKKTPAVKPAKSSGAAVSDPVVLEEDAKPPVNLPERGVVRDSVYESRMTVPHPIDDIERQLAGIQSQADEGTQMADIASVSSVTLDSVIRADRAAEAAETRLIQTQEEEGSVTPDQYEAVSEIGAVPTSETAPEAASPEIDPLDHLKSEVAALRSKYASRQYEHGRMMERLRRSPIGRFLGESDIDKDDLEYWKTEYEEKMTALREAGLSRLIVSMQTPDGDTFALRGSGRRIGALSGKRGRIGALTPASKPESMAIPTSMPVTVLVAERVFRSPSAPWARIVIPPGSPPGATTKSCSNCRRWP